ncbi:MAG: hypothetical protein AAGC60_06045 [Acidobacteriota bacterium]
MQLLSLSVSSVSRAAAPVVPRIAGRATRRQVPACLCCVLVVASWLAVALPCAGQNAAAARLEREAARLADTGEIERAIESYRLLTQQFPDDRLAPGALLAAARLLISTGEERTADDLIESLLTRHPRTEEAAEAFLLRGDARAATARGDDDYRAARTLFRRVPLLFGRDEFPELPARAQARVRSARLGLQIGDREGAVGELVAAIEDEPASAWTGRARRLLGRTWLESGEIDAALEVLQSLADQEGDEPSLVADRRAAKSLLSYADRHILRPGRGLPRWRSTARWPVSGLALREPEGVAAADDGRVVVVDSELPLVALLDASGRPLQSLALDDALRPGFAGDTPYVLTDERIVLPFDGQSLDFLQPVSSSRESPLRNLRAAVRDARGEWLVLARGWRGVLAFSGRRDGRELLGSLRPDLVDIERDSLGRTYVLDEDSERVLRISVDRMATDPVIAEDWRRPVALALDILGTLYVLDRGERQVFVYSAAGRRVDTIGPDLGAGIELRNPVDLAVDGAGRLFIADTKLPFLVVLE